jgi:hypothetical protein
MIINNTCPNVRIFAYEDAKKAKQTVFIFPGVNGEIPDAVAESEAFKEQREAGLLIVIPQKKDATKIDPTRVTLTPDQLAKVPDEDVIAVVLDMEEKKALALVVDIVKRPTLLALKAREKRASIIAAVEKQITDIDNLNLPPRK